MGNYGDWEGEFDERGGRNILLLFWWRGCRNNMDIWSI